MATRRRSSRVSHRAGMARSSSRPTRGPEIDVSATSATHSRVKSSMMARMRKRRASPNTSDRKSRLQRTHGPAGSGMAPECLSRACAAAALHGETFLAIEPPQFLVVHGDPLPLEHQADPPITEAPPLGRDLTHTLPDLRVVRHRLPAHGLRIDAHQPAGRRWEMSNLNIAFSAASRFCQGVVSRFPGDPSRPPCRVRPRQAGAQTSVLLLERLQPPSVRDVQAPELRLPLARASGRSSDNRSAAARPRPHAYAPRISGWSATGSRRTVFGSTHTNRQARRWEMSNLNIAFSAGLPLLPGRRQPFPRRSFKTALSSSASASRRFRRAFSCSSVFSRRASETSKPPNFAFHLMGWMSLPPTATL